MHINHEYLLAKSQFYCSSQGKILDYGCGEGDVVVEGRKRNLNIYGVEEFYGGSNAKEIVKEKGLLGNFIRELDNGKIPFPNQCFDLVVSNQVFEHVVDLKLVVGEIHRVLKKDGILLCLFPSIDVIREGHCGIPIAHWIPSNYNLRYYWLLFWRQLGLGYEREFNSSQEWARYFDNWLTKYTYYRSQSEIYGILGQYFKTIENIEEDNLRYRLETLNLHSWSVWLKIKPINLLASFLFRKMMGLVLLMQKK